MQSTLRLWPSRPLWLRFRFIRRLRVVIVRYLEARLREESPVIDPITPAVSDRSGFRIRPPV